MPLGNPAGYLPRAKRAAASGGRRAFGRGRKRRTLGLDKVTGGAQAPATTAPLRVPGAAPTAAAPAQAALQNKMKQRQNQLRLAARKRAL